MGSRRKKKYYEFSKYSYFFFLFGLQIYASAVKESLANVSQKKQKKKSWILIFSLVAFFFFAKFWWLHS